MKKCTGCGACWNACPKNKIPNVFDFNLGNRTAIYVPFPQAVPAKPVIDAENCTKLTTGKCGICEKKCAAGAIKYDDHDEIVVEEVGAIIADGCVYVLDYIDEEDSDALRCFAVLTGEEIWRRGYKNPIRRNHGKSRTVPAYADGVVVSFGPAGHVMAVDAKNGDLLWSRDLVREYRCKIPEWYAGQCPLIDDGNVILGVGGETVLMASLDLKSGATVWELICFKRPE